MCDSTMLSKIVCVLALIATASASSRIFGGSPTTIIDYPFAASILNLQEDLLEEKCVGSIISSWHVLTSAHCFTGLNYETMKVRAGSTYSNEGGVLVPISRLIIHPDYEQSPRRADITIVELGNYLPISDTIGLAYIPPQQTDIPDDYPLVGVSWGFSSEEDDSQVTSLEVVRTQTISLEQCREAYADEDDIYIYDQVLCTSASDVGLCRGDTGAPLVWGRVLVGVTSVGACGARPDVHSRVDRHTGWILEHAVPPAGWSGVPVRVAH